MEIPTPCDAQVVAVLADVIRATGRDGATDSTEATMIRPGIAVGVEGTVCVPVAAAVGYL